MLDLRLRNRTVMFHVNLPFAFREHGRLLRCVLSAAGHEAFVRCFPRSFFEQNIFALQKYGNIADVEIIFNERGSKVRWFLRARHAIIKASNPAQQSLRRDRSSAK